MLNIKIKALNHDGCQSRLKNQTKIVIYRRYNVIMSTALSFFLIICIFWVIWCNIFLFLNSYQQVISFTQKHILYQICVCAGILVWRAGIPVDGAEGRVLQGVQTPVGQGSVDPDHCRQCLSILHSMYDCCEYQYYFYFFYLRVERAMFDSLSSRAEIYFVSATYSCYF